MSDELTTEVTRLRAENQKLREEILRLREELQRAGRYLAAASKADEDREITWGYQRGDLEDDLGVE